MPYEAPTLLFPILLIWSAIWAGVATFVLHRAFDVSMRPFWRGFWLMNGLWAVVNILIVAWGLIDPVQTREELLGLLRLNSYLDIGYICIAIVMFYMMRKPMVRGLAVGIFVQGMFLLIFDLSWKAVLY